MNFINNTKISNKLLLTTVFPLIGLFIFAFMQMQAALETKAQVSNVVKNAENIKLIGNAIHELQKERGLSVGFLNGGIERSKVDSQRGLTDATLGILAEKSLSDVKVNTQNRQLVDTQTDAVIAFKSYSSMITDLLKQVEILSDNIDDGLSADAKTYMLLARLKEMQGQTRGLISGVLSKNSATKEQLYSVAGMNFGFLILEKSFEENAPSDIKIIYENSVKKAPEREEIKKIVNCILENGENGHYDIKPQIWFDSITVLMDEQHKTEQALISKIINDANTQLQKATTTFFITLLLVILLLSISVWFSYIVGKLLNKSVRSLKQGFENLNSNCNQSMRLSATSSDEIGEIVLLFNTYMDKLNSIAILDKQAIAAVEKAARGAGLGFIAQKIDAKAGSEEVRQAIVAINAMLESIENALHLATEILTLYARADFRSTDIGIGVYGGEIGGMLMAMKGMGESVGDFVALIGVSGGNLKNGSQGLADAAEILSASASRQASSLEETAASLEQIAANLHNSTHKSTEMAHIAKITKKSSEFGLALTEKTVDIMDNIVNSATAINEAVAIIDHIAFQTHILSLNAAIEAASAGDAGKGFAVVASEVRNLAARSAEAAKHILVLVKDTQNKAYEGKRATDDMQAGFNNLAIKIDATSNLIADVTSAANEQMKGVKQINVAVDQLNSMTTQNSKGAFDLSTIANHILQMSETLSSAADRAKYAPESAKRVCRIDLMFDTSKLKLDHVNFKNNNFAKLKDTKISAWTVTDDKECDLGKWILAHSKEAYANKKEWQELKNVHSHVHQKVQEYINKKIGNATEEELKCIALEIEQDTASLFGYLNKIRALACENDEYARHLSHQAVSQLSHKF